jgi:hypothetical protein
MHVGHDAEPRLAAQRPERPIAGAVEDDDAAVQAVRVEVVVEDEALDGTPLPVLVAE